MSILTVEDKTHLAKAIYSREQRKRINPLLYFKPQDYQLDFHLSKKKNKGVFGGNRSGKTINGAKLVIQACIDNPGIDCWGATWADMLVPILEKAYWDLLPKDGTVKYVRWTEQRGFANKIIIFRNGSKIRFKTYDQGRESFQGAKKDIIHLDEEPPEDITNECRARLIDTAGTLLRTMTPLDGITYTYDEMVVNDKKDEEIEYWFWDSSQNKYIDQVTLDRTIGSYAAKEAEVRKTGHFVNLTSGAAYYSFSDENIIDKFDYMNYRPLEISCDFNIDLMSWHIGQEREGKDYTFSFVELEGQANTDLLCQMLKNKYDNHQGGWIFYGDISGSQRRPESSRTNWAIIKEHFPSAQIYYQNIPNIKDRVDATNARIKNSKNEIFYFITKDCKRLIKDYRQVTWEMLVNKQKAGKLTHASDGETYKFFWKYDLRGKAKTKQYNLQ
ncbi:MAG: hypothetical protein IPJ03_16660 [Ignavibacteriales bacterium]|nr:hypothetical protein [Ignavibacteriales bacterium]